MRVSDFIIWLKSVCPGEQREILPEFLDWLSTVREEPWGDDVLALLEKFALDYAPASNNEWSSDSWGWRWLVLRALEGCWFARRFHEKWDSNTSARELVSEFRKDLKDLRGHLEGALVILRRHDGKNNPLLAGHVLDLWIRGLPDKNVELYEKQEFIRRGPGIAGEKGVVLLAEGTKGQGRTLKVGTIIHLLEAFLDNLKAAPRFPSDCGAHMSDFGCLSFLEPRSSRYKKPTEVVTMLAAYLVTLFACYRRGLPDPLYRWTPVEKGNAEDHTLAAGLINATLPVMKADAGALETKSVKDRLEKLLKRNPGVTVGYWLPPGAT
jgi:hypothetical protein